MKGCNTVTPRRGLQLNYAKTLSVPQTNPSPKPVKMSIHRQLQIVSNLFRPCFSTVHNASYVIPQKSPNELRNVTNAATSHNMNGDSCKARILMLWHNTSRFTFSDFAFHNSGTVPIKGSPCYWHTTLPAVEYIPLINLFQ